MPAPRIVFMGTPDFAVPSLDALVEAGMPPVAVVTVPDRARGRGQQVQPSAAKRAAERHGIDVLQPDDLRDPAFAEALGALEPDIIAVVAFRILPPEVYGVARQGAFNLHASLLPQYRGAAPINRAIMAGEIETGVTTFLLQPKVDTGDTLLMRRLGIGPDETAGELHDRLAALGAEVVVETAEHLASGTAEALRQDEARVSYAPKLFREDTEIDWSRPAAAVHNLVRGLSPYPAAWTTHGDTLLKLYRTCPAKGSGEPGEVIEAEGECLVVACGERAVEVLELQREGKAKMSAEEFLRGYSFRPGERLG
ncbi:MAG: methionyl-tRNA formyltransferase [Bacteroidota bacterium]